MSSGRYKLLPPYSSLGDLFPTGLVQTPISGRKGLVGSRVIFQPTCLPWEMATLFLMGLVQTAVSRRKELVGSRVIFLPTCLLRGLGFQPGQRRT